MACLKHERMLHAMNAKIVFISAHTHTHSWPLPHCSIPIDAMPRSLTLKRQEFQKINHCLYVESALADSASTQRPTTKADWAQF
jgi:hypothetical protein